MNTHQTPEHWEKGEYARVIRLANELLDDSSADPDDELRMLSRQFLRQIERADHYKNLLSQQTAEVREKVAGLKQECDCFSPTGEVFCECTEEDEVERDFYNSALSDVLALLEDKK